MMEFPLKLKLGEIGVHRRWHYGLQVKYTERNCLYSVLCRTSIHLLYNSSLFPAQECAIMILACQSTAETFISSKQIKA